MRHLDLLQRFLFKDNWMEELGSEVAGGSEDSQRIEPRSKTQLSSTGRLVKSEQPSVSLTQEIGKDVLFGCESTNVSTERPVKSCVPVSVERSDKDKDADENVDADQIKHGETCEWTIHRFVHTARGNRHWLQSVWNCHLQLWNKQKTSVFANSWRRSRVILMREALQADLQQNNVYNPFSDDSKAMIREMGNVELFELCETIPKVQCSECLLYWNQGVIYCTCGHLSVESECSEIFCQWRLDALF